MSKQVRGTVTGRLASSKPPFQEIPRITGDRESREILSQLSEQYCALREKTKELEKEREEISRTMKVLLTGLNRHKERSFRLELERYVLQLLQGERTSIEKDILLQEMWRNGISQELATSIVEAATLRAPVESIRVDEKKVAG